MLDAWDCEEGQLLERLPDGRKCRFVVEEQKLVNLPCGCCFDFDGWMVEVVWEDTGEDEWLDAEELREID